MQLHYLISGRIVRVARVIEILSSLTLLISISASLSPFLSQCFSFSLSLSFTLTVSLTLSLSLSHTHSLSFLLSLSHTHTLSLTLYYSFLLYQLYVILCWMRLTGCLTMVSNRLSDRYVIRIICSDERRKK